MNLWQKLRRIFFGPSVTKRVEMLDRKNRTMRHDLINIQQRTDIIRRMIEQMREGEEWNRQ